MTLFKLAFKKSPWDLPFPFNEEEKAWKESPAGLISFFFWMKRKGKERTKKRKREQ